MSSVRLKAGLLLIFVAILWGSAFAVQRSLANQIGVFTFNGLRFLFASLTLLIATLIYRRIGSLRPNVGINITTERFTPGLTLGSIGLTCLAGLILFIASSLQQAGLRFTTAGSAGFITSLYVVLVPILLWIIWREKIAQITWLCAITAILGSFLLSAEDDLGFSNGDMIILVGAIFWGLHVILVSRVGWKIDILKFAYGQYFVAGLLNLSFGLWLEGHELNGFDTAMWGILYTAFFSIAMGYTLQIVAQKYSPAADAAIILSTEAVFAAIFGFIFLGEIFTILQIIGCAVILVAIILTALHASNTYDRENLELKVVRANKN